jgi:protein O-GlcNAc transferase
MSVRSLLESAVQMHQNGKLDVAERSYRQVLATERTNPDALQLLGVLLRRKGNLASGIALIRLALRYRPDFPEAHNNLGNALVDASQPAEAIASYRRALALRPDYMDCWRSLTDTLLRSGDEMAALVAFESLVRHAPVPADLLNYAILLNRHGRRDAALTQYDRAIAQAPHLARAYWLRGGARSEVETTQQEAIADMREALRLAPTDIEIHCFLGVLLRRAGDLDEACACFEAVLAQDPEHWAARYLICLSQLRPVYASTAAIADSRHRYATHLGQLHEAVMRASPDELKRAADAFGLGTPFLLPYQGQNDRELQRLWGGMVCHAMAARCPEAAGQSHLEVRSTQLPRHTRLSRHTREGG